MILNFTLDIRGGILNIVWVLVICDSYFIFCGKQQTKILSYTYWQQFVRVKPYTSFKGDVSLEHPTERK